MTNQSVDDLSNFLNRNRINQTILKVETLIQMAFHCELPNVPSYVLHDYFWILDDFILEIKKLVDAD